MADSTVDDTRIVTPILNCARCQVNHASIRFSKLTHPIDDYTYWAPCPTNGEPLLMKVIEVDDDDPCLPM